VAGGRKVYFSDSGLLNIIGRVNEGQLLENTVANQLSNYGDLSYLNKRNTAEIDFIVDKELAFEVKLNATKKDLKKLSHLSNITGLKEYWLVSKKYVGLEKTVFPMFL
jgi:predicted AAA+ superfamily ATPase